MERRQYGCQYPLFCHAGRRGCNTNNVAGTSNITWFCAGYEGKVVFYGTRDYNAIVLYFQHAANPVDHQGNVAIILCFVCKQLVTCEEDQWGLRLYFGDRDDDGASKMLNFDNSDKVVVCLTQEFIDDSELPGDGA